MIAKVLCKRQEFAPYMKKQSYTLCKENVEANRIRIIKEYSWVYGIYSCCSLSSFNKTVLDNDSTTLEKDSGNHYSLRYGVDMYTGILPISGF